MLSVSGWVATSFTTLSQMMLPVWGQMAGLMAPSCIPDPATNQLCCLFVAALLTRCVCLLAPQPGHPANRRVAGNHSHRDCRRDLFWQDTGTGLLAHSGFQTMGHTSAAQLLGAAQHNPAAPCSNMTVASLTLMPLVCEPPVCMQLCHLAAMTTALQGEQVVYFDTTNAFSPARAQQLVDADTNDPQVGPRVPSGPCSCCSRQGPTAWQPTDAV